ncbi:hypothetical protein ScalyP_jg2416 [Parmales sp. scaly parma]|nr:hypothetical protein ScalyP_jg2416 [Parmales sp. scaly parma]
MTSFAEKIIVGDSTKTSSSWLNCSIVKTSSSQNHAFNCSQHRLIETKYHPKDSRWITHTSFSPLNPPTITLELNSKALLSYIEISNLQTSEIDIEVAMDPGKHNFIPIKKGVPLARNRTCEVPVGHIPCRFVKIICRAGKPVSMHAIRLNGIDVLSIHDRMGPSTENLLYRATENILYGPSLRVSRPIEKPRHNKMQKVGGDKPNKSYSYTTNLETPASNVMSRDGGLVLSGHNMAKKKLEEALNNLSSIPDSPNVYTILPEGVGGFVSKDQPRLYNNMGEDFKQVAV